MGAGGVDVCAAMETPSSADHEQLRSHVEPLSFVAHQKAQACSNSQLRIQRAIMATASGIALLVLVAMLNLSDNTDVSRGAIELEMLKALEEGAESSVKSAGKTIDVATLVAEGQGKVKEELKALQDKAGKEEAKASALDKQVVSAERKLKKYVLKAKQEQVTGAESEVQAKADVSRASLLRRKAEKLRDESEKARRQFVAQEKPVEMATRLAGHDHHDYREDELKVAQQVAILSEHPTDPALRNKVDKLVKESKVAKGKMAEDQVLLTRLEKQTASARLGGTRGYTHLKAQSVHIAKSAEGLADEAVTLAKEGHAMKDKARKTVAQVEEKMKKPDELHAEAAAERADYKAKMAKVAKLEAALHNMHNARLKQEKEHAAASAHKYSGMRSELEREAGVKSSSSSSSSSSSQDQREEDQLKVAKDSYDQLEELEMKKEKAKLRQERQAKLTQGRGGPAAESEVAALKAAEKRAHILSAKQSTFLSGLFSDKAPWDTKRNVQD